MSSFPILYTFRRCPYAMRARMALTVSGATFAWREVLLRDKPEEMLEVSPKGTVPVLVLPDGDTVIDESLDVMLWALGQGDPQGWLPLESDAQQDQMALIARNDGPYKQHLDRYKYATRYEDVDATAERDSGFAILMDLDSRLARQSWLSGKTVGLADYAIFPFVRQFRIASIDWFDEQDAPHLQQWLARLMGSDLFDQIMTKQSPWVPGDRDYLVNAQLT